MFNPLDLLKKQQNSPTFPDMAPGGLGPQSMSPDPTDLMNPSPRDVQFEQLVNLINTMPQRSQYEPSKFKKIMAAVAGLGAGGPAAYSNGAALGYKSDVPSGLKIQQGILDMPFNKAMSDWEDKEKPLLESARLENARNTNERLTRSNERTATIRDRTVTRQIDRDRELADEANKKIGQGQQKIDIAKQRATAYVYGKEHPNHVYKEDKNGNVYSINPQDNTVEVLYDDDGMPIKSAHLPEEMKLKIQHNNRISEIDESGSQTRKTEETKQTDRLALEDKKNTDILTRPDKRGSPVKNETPAQKKVRLYNLAAEARNKNPDWKNYIKLSPGNNFTINIPEGKSGLFGWNKADGGNAKTATAINDFIYGSTPAASNVTAPEVETKGESKPEVRKDGKTHVKRKSDGQAGWVTNPDMYLYDIF